MTLTYAKAKFDESSYLYKLLVTIVVPGVGCVEPTRMHVEAEGRPVPIVHAVEAFQQHVIHVLTCWGLVHAAQLEKHYTKHEAYLNG